MASMEPYTPPSRAATPVMWLRCLRARLPRADRH
uniref:Uncharacterized protein n=1 Tax=Arundo donax TaxID=35708 RepID=A0A0A8ZTK9_ARUDO